MCGRISESALTIANLSRRHSVSGPHFLGNSPLTCQFLYSRPSSPELSDPFWPNCGAGQFVSLKIRPRRPHSPRQGTFKIRDYSSNYSPQCQPSIGSVTLLEVSWHVWRPSSSDRYCFSLWPTSLRQKQFHPLPTQYACSAGYNSGCDGLVKLGGLYTIPVWLSRRYDFVALY